MKAMGLGLMAGRERKEVNQTAIAVPGKAQKSRRIHLKAEISLAIEKVILVPAVVVSLAVASQITNVTSKIL